MPAMRPGVELRTATDGTKTYRVRWRPGGGRGARMQSHTFPRLVAANALHDELLVGGWICYCRKHAPDGEPTSPVPTGLRPRGDHVVTPAAGPLFGPYARRHAASMTGIGEGYRRDVLRDINRHLQVFHDRPLEAITPTDVREWIRGFETGSHPWLHRAGCRWSQWWLAEKAKAAAAGTPLAEVLARGLEANRGVAPCSMPAPDEDEDDEDRPACSPVRSVTTVKRNLTQAGGVMQAAYNEGKVSRNVFRGHRLARRQVDHHADMQFLTHAEWGLLRSCIPEGVYRDLCTCLVGTGLRWGEVSALAVGAVDVLTDPPRLHVARAWKKDGKGGVVLGAPKSSRSRRTVTFTTAVRDALIPHVAGKADEEFVFTTPHAGRPLLHSNFYGKVWLPAVAKAQKAGLEKRPRLHDLRHTYVSWLIAENRPIAEISRRIGHQSYNLTADRYGHIMPQSDTATLAALERALPVSAATPDDSDPASPESGSSATP